LTPIAADMSGAKSHRHCDVAISLNDNEIIPSAYPPQTAHWRLAGVNLIENRQNSISGRLLWCFHQFSCSLPRENAPSPIFYRNSIGDQMMPMWIFSFGVGPESIRPKRKRHTAILNQNTSLHTMAVWAEILGKTYFPIGLNKSFFKRGMFDIIRGNFLVSFSYQLSS
jgi:hypothetical protein